jgi:hypothetical protein
MENGKATQREMKAEAVGWSARDPNILKDTNGLKVILIAGCSLKASCKIKAWYKDHVCLFIHVSVSPKILNEYR